MTGPVSKSVTVHWSAGLSFHAESVEGGDVEMLSDDGVAGFRPTAMLLAAMAACTGMDVISILHKKRQDVDAYDIAVRGERRGQHPRTFSLIQVEHRFSGSAIADAAVARAIELSATRYCSVSAQLASGDVVIRSSYQISDEAGERTGEVSTTGPFGAGLAPAVQ